MKEIKCPYDLNQFLLGEPIFENTFPEEECEQRKFYGDCFHCFATAIVKRDHQLKLEELEKRIKGLEQQLCEDTISRQAVLNTLNKMDKALDTDRTVESYKELLTECYKDLPPITKVGK